MLLTLAWMEHLSLRRMQSFYQPFIKNLVESWCNAVYIITSNDGLITTVVRSVFAITS